jgi:hypothetical protein
VGGRFVRQQTIRPHTTHPGALTPSYVAGGRVVHIGATGRRADDGGPAYRHLRSCRLDGADDRVERTFAESGDPEEGIFSATPRGLIGAVRGRFGTVHADVRDRHDQVVLQSGAPWGHGTELFPHSDRVGGGFRYITQDPAPGSGSHVRWGLGLAHADGTTHGLIDPAAGEEVCGGGAWGETTLLVRGLQLEARNLEWYVGDTFAWPVRVEKIPGLEHATPWHDGRRWRLAVSDAEGMADYAWDPHGSPAAAADELDPRDVHWLHAAAGPWPVTSRVTGVTWEPGPGPCIWHTQAGRWPPFTKSGQVGEGNPWVFAEIAGQWYGATFEWLRPGQQCRAHVSAAIIGPLTERSPLQSWRPRPGERVGFMVSTPARDHTRTANERSQIVLARWPA